MNPSYINLFENGELEKRANSLYDRLQNCDLCPWECKVNRFKSEKGKCFSSHLPIVSSYCLHNGEEPPLCGKFGVGNIFFGNCNLNCQFCQNYQISQDHKLGNQNTVSFEDLADIMIELQNKHASAIGLVSPTHFVPHILKSLVIAIKKGLKLPIIYNCNGYDKPEILQYLDGIVDIYLPDFKYSDDSSALTYSKAKNYFNTAGNSISEMYRQVGDKIIYNIEGNIVRGLIIRHLVLPNDIAGSENIFKFLSENLSNKITISLMSQYFPAYKVKDDLLLNRSIRESEYEKVLSLLEKYKFENGWVQEFNSTDFYKPDFSDKDNPFKNVI